jgi:hypothetical protein
VKLRHARDRAVGNSAPDGNRLMLGLCLRVEGIRVRAAMDDLSTFLDHAGSAPFSGRKLKRCRRDCVAIVLSRILIIHCVSLERNDPSMSILQSTNARLLCETCHGIGYEQTAAGKVACGECNPAYPDCGACPGNGSICQANCRLAADSPLCQESSEPVSNHQEMSALAAPTGEPIQEVKE